MTKNYYFQTLRKYAKSLGFAALMTLTGNAFTQISGNVTVGSGGTYSSMAALASAISGSGVNGALNVTVTSNLSASSMVEFRKNASLPPTKTNTITIDGKGFKLTSTNNDAAILLNGISYVTIKNLTIEKNTTSTDQKGVQFMNNAQYNTIDNCSIEFARLSSGTTSTSSGGAYIVFSQSKTSMSSSSSSGPAGSYNTVQNCTMKTTNSNSPGPHSAIFIFGSSSWNTSKVTNNTFKGNTIENFYYFGVYNYYTNGEQFIDNDFSRKNATSNNAYSSPRFIYSYYTRSTNRSTTYDGNNFHDLPYKNATSRYGSTVYGFYAYRNYGTASNYFTIKNNTFENIECNSSNYFGYCYYNYYGNYDGNTVKNWNSNGSSSYMYGWYVYYGYNDLKFNNNVIRDCYSRYYTYLTYIYYPTKCEVNNNKIINNRTAQTSSAYTYTLYVYRPGSSVKNTINNNVIDSNWFGYYTYNLYVYYFNGEINNNRLTNNLIRRTSGTGVGYLYNTYIYYYYNLRFNNNVIANNLGYYGCYHLYAPSYYSGNYKVEFRDNTIKADGDVYNSGYQYNYNYLFYVYPYYHNDIRVTGNSIDGRNLYYVYFAYTYNTGGLNNYKEWDYNNYYLYNNSNQYAYNPGGNANNVSGWINTGLPGDHETSHMPVYADEDKNDWRIQVFELQNKVPLFKSNNTWAPKENKMDQLGKDRNLVKHDHGAQEDFMNISGTKTDATISAIVCSGHELEGDITIKNNYVDTIYGFNITMMSDRGAKVTQTVSDRILPGNSLKVNFDDKLILNEPGKTNIMIFVDAADDDLSDDTIYLETEVLPAPGGGMYTASTKSTNAVYQLGKPNDVTILGSPVIYDVNAPTKFSNATYGTTSDWSAEVQAYTASGTAVTGATLTAPSGSTDLEVQFVTNDATYEDSILTIVTRVIDHNNNCDTFIKRDVLIYPSITPLFAFPAQICEGAAVLFENNSKVSSGGMEFSWDFGTGNASDKTDAPAPVFQFPGSKTYKVTLTAKTAPYGFAFDTTMDVTVNPIPAAAFAKTNACEGETLTFTNKTVPTTAAMKWSFGDGTTATSKDATKKYSKAGQYEVTLEADLNGCVATVVQKVYQFDKPVAAFDKVNGNCDNDVFEFENKSTITAGLIGSYWDFDDNGSVSTDDNAMYDFSTSGDKQVKLVVTSEFGCKDSMIKTISIKESPKVSFTNGPLCSVKPTDFINTTGDVANAIANYRWDFGDGTTSGAKSPSHDWKGNLGPKKVSLKVTLDNGCEDIVSKDLVVLTQPTPEFTAGEACSGDEIAFVNNTTWAQGKISYRWDFGDGTTSTNSDPVKVYNVTQSYYPNVTLYAFIEGGCGDSITKTNYVLINEKPRTCDFVAEVDYSFGFFGVKVEPMNASGVVGGQNDADYIWVFEGAGTQKTSGTDAAAYNNLPADGEYRITMRATMQQSGCECSATKTIVMNRSAAEQLSKSGVAVYPNPNNGQFQVVTSETFGTDVQITMMDMNGRVVKTQNHGSVNASELSAGMYLVRVSNGTESVTTKIQINK